MLVDGYPLVIDLERSSGSIVRDRISGKELLDFFSFFASNPIGLNHPRMVADEMQTKLARAGTFRVSNSDFYTGLMADFVAKLSSTAAPAALPYFFFVDGGALAVENAMKTAFDWKVRKNLAAGRGELGKQVLHLEKAFHGRSGYTLSVTNTDPVKTRFFPQFDWPRIPSPAMRFPLAEHQTQVAEAEAASIAAAKQAFAEHPHDIAAILIEPIQGEGGDNHFRPEYLKELRKLADEHEALLIFDEVQTGLGLTGSWWAFEQLEVVPDIISFAKKMQVGGIFASKRLDEVENHVFQKSSRINSTWGGSLVDMVRCQRILEIIDEENLLQNVRDRGAELMAGLESIQDRFDEVSNVRGRGLMCALDLPNVELREAIVRRCYDDGMIILPCGPKSLRFRPSLNVTAEVIGDGVRILGKAIEAAV